MAKKIRRVVMLDEGEEIVVIKKVKYYQLGYPFEEVVFGNTIVEAAPVTWDEISQSWLK